MSEENSKPANEDYEFADITIDRKGKKRNFRISEIGGLAFTRLTTGLNHQDEAKQTQAREVFGANLIAATSSEDGQPITFDKACALPSSIFARLIKEANTLNGASEEAKEEAKNA
jgi:hypothetical protein